MAKSRYYVEALARGLEILSLFTTDRVSLSLTDIATATHLNKSTTFRMVSTLVTLGYLERISMSNCYRPGLKVLHLGFAAISSLDISQIAQPYLKSLTSEIGETTNMSIRDGADIIYVARNTTRHIIGLNIQSGSRLPAYCTAMGKAQLIDLSRQDLFNLLGEGPYPKRGKNTITSLDALVSELDRVRQQRYAINDEELVEGLRSVAAPICDSEGKVVAAINISVAGGRLSRQEIEANLAPKIVEIAYLISLALGVRSSLP